MFINFHAIHTLNAFHAYSQLTFYMAGFAMLKIKPRVPAHAALTYQPALDKLMT